MAKSTSDSVAILQGVMLESLREGDRIQAQTVCMPLLGLSHFQFSVTEAIDALRKALNNFFMRKPQHMKQLVLLDMQQEIAMCLKKAVEKIPQSANSPAVPPGKAI
jgi:hypothetical protein